MASNTAYGHIEPFNVNDPTGWESYQERIEFYLQANEIVEEDKRRAVFRSLCGPATYEVLRTLLALAKVSTKSYDEITAKLKGHFAPRTSEVVCRFKFHRREQLPGESIADYLKELRHCAEKCNFGETLEVMIRDRVVCGVRDETLKRRLLAECNLTYQKTVDLCAAFETATRSLQALKDSGGSSSNAPNGSSAGEHFVRANRTVNVKRPQKVSNRNAGDWRLMNCFRCGSKHSPEECKFKETNCRFCGKTGHLEKVCFKKRNRDNAIGKPRKVNSQSVENRKTEQVSENVESEYEGLHKIRTVNACGKYVVTVLINNKPVVMEVDSGAAHSVMGKSTFLDIVGADSTWKLQRTGLILRDYQNKVIPTLGECQVPVQRGSYKSILPLIVVQDNRASLRPHMVWASWVVNRGHQSA